MPSGMQMAKTGRIQGHCENVEPFALRLESVSSRNVIFFATGISHGCGSSATEEAQSGGRRAQPGGAQPPKNSIRAMPGNNEENR